MNTLLKATVKDNAPVNPTGRKPSAREMHARVKARYPRTMARLAE